MDQRQPFCVRPSSKQLLLQALLLFAALLQHLGAAQDNCEQVKPPIFFLPGVQSVIGSLLIHI